MENIVNAFNSIKDKKIFSIVCIFAGVVMPGTLILYHYDKVNFSNFSLGKIIILSLAISVPIYLVNICITITSSLIPSTCKDDEEKMHWRLNSGGALSCLTTIVILSLSYFAKYEFRRFLFVFAVAEVAVIFIYVVVPLLIRKNKTVIKEVSM
jgi:hypothetical protein